MSMILIGAELTSESDNLCKLLTCARQMSHYLTLPPVLDEFESTATLGQRCESLTSMELEILLQLLRYPEEPLSRDALKRAAGFDDDSVPDRKLDAWLTKLIRKLNVLWPLFPMVRFVTPDHYVYSERAPRRKV